MSTVRPSNLHLLGNLLGMKKVFAWLLGGPLVLYLIISGIVFLLFATWAAAWPEFNCKAGLKCNG